MHCVVHNCGSFWNPNTNVKFHSFPRDSTKRTKWLSLIKTKGKFYSTARICSLHFKPEDYRVDRPGHLLSNAKPFYSPVTCDCVTACNKNGPHGAQHTTKFQKSQTITPQQQKSKDQNWSRQKDTLWNQRLKDIHSVASDDMPEWELIIAKVYHYLKLEYESLKHYTGECCDLSHLADILRRTADATGYTEHTVTCVLAVLDMCEDNIGKSTKEIQDTIVRDKYEGSSAEEIQDINIGIEIQGIKGTLGKKKQGTLRMQGKEMKNTTQRKEIQSTPRMRKEMMGKEMQDTSNIRGTVVQDMKNTRKIVKQGIRKTPRIEKEKQGFTRTPRKELEYTRNTRGKEKQGTLRTSEKKMQNNRRKRGKEMQDVRKRLRKVRHRNDNVSPKDTASVSEDNGR